jgi:glyoxylase-like metal-dependent hydrolase (beta-lactamase superfamily II)
VNILNVGYDSTNYYLLADRAPRLLIDAGFPGTLPKLRHACSRMGVRVEDIPYFVATHYHPDHAGLARELQQAGTRLVVMEGQAGSIPGMRAYMKPEQRYREPDLGAAVRLSFAESRAWLAKAGIAGEVMPTPGHSDDSVSVVLDEGAAFTGDLTPETMTDDATVAASWAKLRAFGMKRVYPGHGG